MNTQRPDNPPEVDLIGIKKLSAEIQTLNDNDEIMKKQHQLNLLVEHFWKVAENNVVISGEPDNNNSCEVTIVFKRKAETNEQIKLAGDFLKPNEKSTLEVIPGTDIYQFSKKVPYNLRNEFIILKEGDDFDEKWEKDRHILSMPNARDQPFVPDLALAEAELKNMRDMGRFLDCTIEEEGAYKGRKYSVHLPENYDATQKYPVLLCFDGQEYQSHIPTPSIMDRMIATNEIKPTITILLANAGVKERFDEYNCDTAFTDFLAKKFMPKFQKDFNVSEEPKDITVAGSSIGGLCAIYAGLTHPEVFGNVVSLSGSLWKDDIVTPSEKFKNTTHERLQTAIDEFPNKSRELTIEMKVGTFENDNWAQPNGTNKDGPEGKCRSMLKVNHDFADIMNGKGIKAVCHEYCGGHNDACWRGLLSEGLTHKPLQEKIPEKLKSPDYNFDISSEVNASFRKG